MNRKGEDGAYDALAYVYDELMDDIPYTEWCDILDEMIKKHGISRPVGHDGTGGSVSGYDHDHDHGDTSGEDNLTKEEALESEKNLVVDLGCGTGTLTGLMYKRGYDMIGIDISEAMLDVAQQKRFDKEYDILYINQDMRDLDLYSTVGTVYSVCDTVNYLLNDEDVIRTFSLVAGFLYPGGLFMFDFNTIYKYEKVIGNTTIAENAEDCAFIWDNFYDENECINEYDLCIFVKQDEPDLFRRYLETHYQRGYTLGQMHSFLKKAGLDVLLVRDSETKDQPTGESQRIFIVAVKKSEEQEG
ncbi:MAG: class I SAM-dependent methyltransferase [Lachnospiraceae bacterium]|nr:class I SAM-dependent methyltransferase [Lachnospiraceae bacterium]